MGRSICPDCETELKARWNVPIVGWLVLRGRARCCGAKISIRYPLIEFASAVAAACASAVLGFGIVFAAGAGIVLLSVLISVTTLKWFD
jgi:leader peptidase (prepilin peptidase)/N-methyltransferase